MGVGRGTVGAAPDECAVFCADQLGPRKAQCRQTCKACAGGPASNCFNASTGSFTCADTDPNNCGACGNRCNEGVDCADGTCSVCAADACPSECSWEVTVDGTAVCYNGTASTSFQPCTSSADCTDELHPHCIEDFFGSNPGTFCVGLSPCTE